MPRRVRVSRAHARAAGSPGLPSDAAAVVPLPPPGLPDLLTPAEVAAWLKTSVHAIYAKTERGSLPGATRIGRRLYFFRTDLLAFAEQGRVPLLGEPSGST
jgi:excisionase family DNA binding protein